MILRRCGTGLLAVLIAALALALGAAGCGAKSGSPSSAGSSGPGPAVAAGTVQISNYKFLPASIVVSRGARVTFANHDTSPHTATANDMKTFDSGTLQPGHLTTVVLSRAGTFLYHCQFHAFMTATITVK